jgi:acyl-CoA synthetase (AMP-forming)/AMP-acid ligase II
MLDHSNLLAMCRSVIDALEITAADHSLLILPLFHVNGLVLALLDCAGFRSADWSYRERTSATGPAESAAPPDRTSGPEIMRFATERLAETVVGRIIYLSHRR